MSSAGTEGRRVWPRELALFGAFLLAAVVLTWPLARLLPVAVAHPGDPLLNTYIVSWDVYASWNQPLRPYDAGFYFPARYALAFSENLFGLWPLAALLLAVTTPLATHNLLLLAGIAFSCYGAAVLGRVLTGSTAAAIAAGAVYGLIPWRFVHLSHLQHVWGGWLPLLLAAMVVYDRRRDRRAAAFVAVAFLMNGLSNLHYLVFGAAAAVLVFVVLFLFSREQRTPRDLAPLAAALGLAGIVLVAVLWPYRLVQQTYRFRGDKSETQHYSARWQDWITAAEPEEPERRVFPGYAGPVAALAGLALALRRHGDRTHAFTAALLIVVGVVFSTGLATPLYRFLFDHAPLLSGIRAPARWAVVAYLGITMLVALATRGRFVLAALVAALCIAQSWIAPVRWYLMPREPDAVYAWLRETSLRGGVLELPIGDRDFYYLLPAASHHKPLFNGPPGGTPVYRELIERFRAPRIPDDTLPRLASLGGSTIVVHSDAMGGMPDLRRWLAGAVQRGELGYGGRFEAGLTGDYVFHVGTAGKPADDELRGFLEGRTTLPPNRGPFGVLDFPRPEHVARDGLPVRGWALSGSGIRSVRLWFANKRCFVQAQLEPYPGLQKAAPHHATDSARFRADLPKRPCGGADNDLLVELTDHAGRTTTLPHIWFRWE